MRRKSQRQFASAIAILLAATFAGCSGDGSSTLVQGKISFDGNIVTGGLINFQSARGQPLGGPIEADGTFEFALPPGDYKVRIDTPGEVPPGWKEGDPPPKLGPRQVPHRYARFSTSGLRLSVLGDVDSQQADFELP